MRKEQRKNLKMERYIIFINECQNIDSFHQMDVFKASSIEYHHDYFETCINKQMI